MGVKPKREMTMREGMKQIIFRLLPHEAVELKQYCADHNTSVQELLEIYVQSLLEENKTR